MFEGSSRNGAEQIDRDGLYFEFFESKGEFDALLHRFSHADDTSAADIHSYTAGGGKCGKFLLLCVGGTKLGKIRRSSFQIAMITGNSRFVQGTQFFFIK